MSLYEKIINRQEKISLVGLGYVGMPIAVAFSNFVEYFLVIFLDNFLMDLVILAFPPPQRYLPTEAKLIFYLTLYIEMILFKGDLNLYEVLKALGKFQKARH